MHDWERKFNSSVLNRGKQIFLNRRVEVIRENGEQLEAAVLGKERYEVSGVRKNGKMTRMRCKCPMAKAGNYCEHMAAFLYAIDFREEAAQSRMKEEELYRLYRAKEQAVEAVSASEPQAEKKKPGRKRISAEERERRLQEEAKRREEELKIRAEEEKRRREEEQRLEEEAKIKEEKKAAREQRKLERERKEAERRQALELIRQEELRRRAAEEERRETLRRLKEEEARKKAEKRRQQEELTRRAEVQKKQREEKERRRRQEIERQQEEQERRHRQEEEALQAEWNEKQEASGRRLKEQRVRQWEAEKTFAEFERQQQEASDEALAEIRGRLEEASIRTLEAYTYFDAEKIWETSGLSWENMTRGKKLLEAGAVGSVEVSNGYNGEKETVLGQIEATCLEKRHEFTTRIIFSAEKTEGCYCQCPNCRSSYENWYMGRAKCDYVAAVMIRLVEYLRTHSLADATSHNANALMNRFRGKQLRTLGAEQIRTEEKVRLEPRLLVRGEHPELSFRIGTKKLYVVKSLEKLAANIRNSAVSTYGTDGEINHNRNNFSEESQKWIRFIEKYVREEMQIAARAVQRQRYGRYEEVHVGDALQLFDARLDECYELLAEDEIEYEDRTVSGKKKKVMLRTGEKNPEVRVEVAPLKRETTGLVDGIQVDIHLPVMYSGMEHAYYMDDGLFCRADRTFTEKLQPLIESSRGSGISFQIGRMRMAEFYYQILPELGDAVELIETEPELIHALLPPEAVIRFYLDASEDDVFCRIAAAYGKREVNVLDLMDETVEPEPFRDFGYEQKILVQALDWFPNVDMEYGELTCGREEELVYRVITEGTEALMELGEVHCTDRFSKREVIRQMRVSVGVSLSGGLLDLNVETSELSSADLLELLKNFRLKKRYHRLKDGRFVDLRDSALEMLSELMDSLQIPLKEFVKGKMQIPAYRMLYLDRMLEENETVYSHRDAHFRKAVKEFKTVKDSDFEEPESLAGIMRNYQRTGYKWLRTLEERRFGGILADDMGLGKTLQMIAVLLAAKQEGKDGTSLIVAPASLVYNWKSELEHFAPQLAAVTVTGTARERQEILKNKDRYDVLITSYDLLKRDIAEYEGKQFAYEVLDEAQYIKNHTTAAAKAVKVISGRQRFALTGTPIENRLSELWSIFDYLMPGFLFGYETFRKELEIPIVKNQDEHAMERLQKMVSPFILRRVKNEVLKDLPEKLEEARYIRLDEKQQQLYEAQVVHMREQLAKQNPDEFNKNKFQIFAELTRLRQLCCDPSLIFENYRGESAKAEACMDLIESAMDGGHRLLVFSQFTSMLEILREKLEKRGIEYYTITGSTAKEQRLKLVKRFNEGTVPVFLISLKAGGVGLNLTGADVVIHYDPWWNLAAQNQATDRAHRIGQTKKVTVYRLIAKGTIEEKILKLQETKKDLAEQILESAAGEIGSMTREDLMKLLEV